MIVNPSRLKPELREAVCQQCHLSGVARVLKAGRSLYDFRPGQSLDSCFATFVLHSDLAKDERLVGQVEQMYESRCFQGSDGALGCISCHDPHRLPTAEQRIRFYRDRCLECHATRGCSLNEATRLASSAEDSCMECHMPRHETEVRHAAVVDHRISRSRFVTSAEAAPATNDRLADRIPLQRFPPHTAEGPAGFDRDLAIAMLIARAKHPEILDSQQLRRVASTLQRVTARNPDDLDAFENLGQAYLYLGRVGEALQAYDHVLRRHPGRESSLAVVADVLNSVGEYPRAIQYWQRAIQVNPWIARYWHGLARAYEGCGQWKRCQELAQEATQRFPTSIGARQLLIASHLYLGQQEQAQEAFAWLKRYNPSGMQSLSQWYESHPLRK